RRVSGDLVSTFVRKRHNLGGAWKFRTTTVSMFLARGRTSCVPSFPRFAQIPSPAKCRRLWRLVGYNPRSTHVCQYPLRVERMYVRNSSFTFFFFSRLSGRPQSGPFRND
ncbi:unnamed protein product, partial [Ectocarpus sp. 8 AP-2014]